MYSTFRFYTHFYIMALLLVFCSRKVVKDQFWCLLLFIIETNCMAAIQIAPDNQLNYLKTNTKQSINLWWLSSVVPKNGCDLYQTFIRISKHTDFLIKLMNPFDIHIFNLLLWNINKIKLETLFRLKNCTQLTGRRLSSYYFLFKIEFINWNYFKSIDVNQNFHENIFTTLFRTVFEGVLCFILLSATYCGTSDFGVRLGKTRRVAMLSLRRKIHSHLYSVLVWCHFAYISLLSLYHTYGFKNWCWCCSYDFAFDTKTPHYRLLFRRGITER